MKYGTTQGFTLLGVLASAVLGSIVLASLISMLSHTFESQREIAGQDEIRHLLLKLETILGNQTNCTQHLATRTFNPNLSSLSTQKIPNTASPSLISIHAPGEPTRILAAVDAALPNNGPKITALSLTDFVNVSATEYLADLTVDLTSGAKLAIRRRVPLTLDTINIDATTQKIVACRALSSTAATPPAQRSYCGITAPFAGGDIGGYSGAKTKCEAVCGTGADFCFSTELGHETSGVNSLANGTYWVKDGSGFHGSGGFQTCSQWTSSAGAPNVGGVLQIIGFTRQAVVNQICATPRPLICCR